MNEERVKADVQMVREYLNMIAGNSNPAVVPLAAQAYVIFNHKIVLKCK